MKSNKVKLSFVFLSLVMNCISYAADISLTDLNKKAKPAQVSILQAIEISINNDASPYTVFNNLNDEDQKCLAKQFHEIEKFKIKINDKKEFQYIFLLFPKIQFKYFVSSISQASFSKTTLTDNGLIFNIQNYVGDCEVIDAHDLVKNYTDFYNDHIAPAKDINLALANLSKRAEANNLSCNDGSRNIKQQEVETSRKTASSGNKTR